MTLPNDEEDLAAIKIVCLHVHAPEWPIQRQLFVKIVLTEKVDVALVFELALFVVNEALLYHFFLAHLFVVIVAADLDELVA